MDEAVEESNIHYISINPLYPSLNISETNISISSHKVLGYLGYYSIMLGFWEFGCNFNSPFSKTENPDGQSDLFIAFGLKDIRSFLFILGDIPNFIDMVLRILLHLKF